MILSRNSCSVFCSHRVTHSEWVCVTKSLWQWKSFSNQSSCHQQANEAVPWRTPWWRLLADCSQDWESSVLTRRVLNKMLSSRESRDRVPVSKKETFAKKVALQQLCIQTFVQTTSQWQASSRRKLLSVEKTFWRTLFAGKSLSDLSCSLSSLVTYHPKFHKKRHL